MARNLMEFKKILSPSRLLGDLSFCFIKPVHRIINSKIEGNALPFRPSLCYMNMFSNCEQYLIRLASTELLESCLNENVFNDQYSQR